MPIFKSVHPPIEVPSRLPLWTWLFDSDYSPLRNLPAKEIRGFTNVITKEYLNYLDLKTYSTYLSTALVKYFGLQEDQTVAIFSPNSVWYPCAMFGVLRAGGVISGASPAYNVSEMSYALKTAEAKYLFTVPGSMDVAATAADEAGIAKERVFLLEGTMEGFKSVAQLIEIGRQHVRQVEQFTLPSGKTNRDTCAFLSFSSGTTGLPKAVMISHSNVIAQCLQVQQISPTRNGILAVLPLFHVTGLVHQMHLPILLNVNVYMLPNFTMDSMLATVQEYQLEELLLVPPILIRMIRDEKLLRKYDLSSVKRFSSGAAPLSAEILSILEARFPGTGFKQGYGMTESCSCITSHPPDKYDYKHASKAGTIVPSTEVKIVDHQTGMELGIDQPGEVWARGPQVAMGYLGNRKATQETFDEDGFLHTGDIGSIDKEGFLTITDRLKEMIKVKGVAVAPAELEDLLLGHPEIEDVAVVGIPDEYAGERPKAYVVLKASGRNHSVRIGKELIQYVKENKVRDKWIVEVEFMDEIPKSPSGKILRRVLKNKSKTGEKSIIVRDDRESTAKL